VTADGDGKERDDKKKGHDWKKSPFAHLLYSREMGGKGKEAFFQKSFKGRMALAGLCVGEEKRDKLIIFKRGGECKEDPVSSPTAKRSKELASRGHKRNVHTEG